MSDDKFPRYRFKIKDLSERQIEMIFQLMAADVVFLNGFVVGESALTDNQFELLVLVNDHFVPAADSEPCAIESLEGLYESVLEHGDPCDWTAQQRNIPNEYWKDKHKKDSQ